MVYGRFDTDRYLFYMQEEFMRVDPNAELIINRLKDSGYEAYLVGGCVRDYLLGEESEDWDIVTSALPEVVEGLFAKTVAVGKAFGVIIVVLAGGEYEVATFRSDGAYIDGRKPESVEFATAEEDVNRRDFTINALLYDPAQDEVLDYVGGREDLELRVIRTVGEARSRFLEDHLRLLRAVRFALKTGFEIERNTLAAVTELAGLVRTVSVERVSSELLKMLCCKGAGRVLSLLYLTNLLQHVLPEAIELRGCPQPPEFHPEGDVFTHTEIMLGMFADNLPAGAFEREVLAWAILLHDIAKPRVITVDGRIRFNRHDYLSAEMSDSILTRFKRPKKVIETVHELIGRHMHFSSLEKMRLPKRRRFLQDPLFPLHLELHRIDCASSHALLDTYYFGVSALEEERNRPPEAPALLTGNDLITLGYEPGPLFSRILHALKDAQLEGLVTTREAALDWLKEYYLKIERKLKRGEDE